MRYRVLAEIRGQHLLKNWVVTGQNGWGLRKLLLKLVPIIFHPIRKQEYCMWC